MAHIARIDNVTNIVLHVHVVSNDRCKTEDEGISFLKQLYKDAPWINDVYFRQTSYSSSFRGHYAGIGDIWDEQEQIFKQ